MILILGGSGFVGMEIVKVLRKQNLDFVVVDLRKPVGLKSSEFLYQDLLKENLNADLVKNATVIINLVGSPIVRRFSVKNKALMYQSRVFLTKKVVNQILKYASRKCVYLQASGTAFYKPSIQVVTESGEPGNGFLAELTKDWEEASGPLKQYLKRVVIVRQPIVLGKRGFLGVYRLFKFFKFLPVFKIDNFKMSFIDVYDLASLYVALIDSKFSGVVNATMRKSYDYVNFNQMLKELYNLKPINLNFRFCNYLSGGMLVEFLQNYPIASDVDPKKEFNLQFKSLRACLLRYLK